MSLYDYTAILFYFAFIVGVGLVFRKLNRDSKDYFAGGFRVTWWLVGASAFASNFSAWVFTGAAHMAYTFGTVIFVITITDILGYVLGLAWFGPKLRQLRVVTAMLAVRRRFGTVSEQLYTWLIMVGSLVTATVWLIAVSVALASVFQIPQLATIFLSGATVCVMSLYGGRWAVVASDFIQLVMLISVSLAVFFLTVNRLGGFEEFFAAIPENLRNPVLSRDTQYDGFWIAGFILLSVLSRNNLTTASRYISAKNSKHARWSAAIPILGYAIMPICWFTVPMVARSIAPNLETQYSMLEIPGEASYIAVAIEVLPNGLLGLLVAGMIASTMSSMDAALNRNAGYFVKSVYVRWRRGRALDEGSLLRMGRIVTVVFAVLVVGLSVLIVEAGRLSLFDIYQQLNGRLTVPLAVPVFWGLFVKRVPDWGAWVSLLFGLLVSVAIFDGLHTEVGRYALGIVFNKSWSEYIVTHPVTCSYLVNVPLTSAVFLGTGFFFKKREEARCREVDAFFHDRDRPVDFEAEVGDDNTVFQARSIGIMSIVYGGFVGLFLMIPNPTEGKLAIGGISLLMLSVGGVLLFYSKRRLKRSYQSARK